MRNAIQENHEQTTIRGVIEEYIVNAKVTSLVIDHQGGLATIKTTLQSPNEITSSHVDRLTDILVDRLGRSVNLEINVVPTYEANKNLGGGGNEVD